jgi:hypothetical protein
MTEKIKLYSTHVSVYTPTHKENYADESGD